MKLVWRGLRRPAVPAEVAAAISAGEGSDDRLLAWARADGAPVTVVAGTTHLYAVTDSGDVVLARPWHLVDAGVWNPEEWMLRVTWVDGQPRQRWVFREPGELPQTVHERVQASVVLADLVDLGEGRRGRVVVRRDLGTGALLSQALLGRGVRMADPGVAEAVKTALAPLREQVGLD